MSFLQDLETGFCNVFMWICIIVLSDTSHGVSSLSIPPCGVNDTSHAGCEESSMSTGVRAGIAVGGICAPVLILVCVIVGCYVCRNDPNFRCCPPPEKSTAVIIDERMDPNHPENREVKRGAFTTTTSPDAAVVENLDPPAEPSASGTTTIPTTQQVQVSASPQAAGPATSSNSNLGAGKSPDAPIPPERTRPPPTRKGSVTLEMIPEFQGPDMDSRENIAVTGLFATSFDVQVPVAEQTGDKNGLLDHEEWIDTSVPPHILQQRRDLNEGCEEEDKGADERQREGMVDSEAARTESELGPSPMDVIYDSNAINEHETGAKLDYSSGSISFENPTDYSSFGHGNIGSILSAESHLAKTDGAAAEKLSDSQNLTHVTQSSQDLTCVTQSSVSLHLRKVSSNGGVDATKGSECGGSAVALGFLPKMEDRALQNMTGLKSESSSEDIIKENVQFSKEGHDNPSFIQSTDPSMAETSFSQELSPSGLGADPNKSAQLGPYVSEENVHNPPSPKPLSILGRDSDISHHTNLVTQFSDLGSPVDKRGDDSQNKDLPVLFMENVGSLNRDTNQDCTPLDSSLKSNGHEGSFHIEFGTEYDTANENIRLERYKISSSEHFEEGASYSHHEVIESFDIASQNISVMSTSTSDSMQVEKVGDSEQFPVADQPSAGSTHCPDFSQA